jgi:LAO/AO transport system kinase
MVDFFLELLQPGSGDELQGLKKGVLELADGLVVNKADGDLADAAERARVAHTQALQLLRPRTASWKPRVLTASARTGEGITAVWEMIREQHAALEASGEGKARRREQAKAWMWSLVQEGLWRAFRSHPDVAGRIEKLEAEVAALKITPARAARVLLDAFRSS